MLSTVDALIRRIAPNVLLGLCVLFIALLGTVDFVTGYELSFAILYLAPVAAASWYVSRRSGLVMAAISAGTWLASDWESGHRFSRLLFHAWNAVVGLGFFVVIAYLVSALRTRLSLERQMARMDPLTSAANARAFAETAHRALELASRHGHTTVFGFIDLDNFKRVNDEIGHAGGDHVLKAVADTLRQSVRSSDLVARLGGDEFAILLPETSRDGAERLFAKVQSRLRERVNDYQWPITFSMGVAVFRVPPKSPDEALGVADTLMYRVKTNGKDAVLVEEFPPAEPSSVAGAAVASTRGSCDLGPRS